MKLFGQLMGDSYNVWRPDYTALDNEPVLVYSNIIARTDVSFSYVETAFSTPNYFSIFTDRALMQPGDMLIYGTYGNLVPDRPYITFVQQGPIKEAIGVRTSQKCHLANGRNQETGEYEYVAMNVWYDLLDNGKPLERINPGTNYSPKVPNQSLVIYNRAVEIDIRTMVIDIDPATGLETNNVYIVKQVDKSNTLTILAVEGNLSDY